MGAKLGNFRAVDRYRRRLRSFVSAESLFAFGITPPALRRKSFYAASATLDRGHDQESLPQALNPLFTAK